ncbi:hypothetical protein ACFVQB_11420 [Paenibacillus sp. NPDC057886]|uniref:hypothetical protein n=1 Tax=Paenibacillus sp. NPDC057886 TaxID=3346270 RepID=UPI00369DBA64
MDQLLQLLRHRRELVEGADDGRHEGLLFFDGLLNLFPAIRCLADTRGQFIRGGGHFLGRAG